MSNWSLLFPTSDALSAVNCQQLIFCGDLSIIEANQALPDRKEACRDS